MGSRVAVGRATDPLAKIGQFRTGKRLVTSRQAWRLLEKTSPSHRLDNIRQQQNRKNPTADGEIAS